MTNKKLCKDCRHLIGDYCLCQPRYIMNWIKVPVILRDLEDYCGPDGKWFEPKEVEHD